MTKDEMVGWHHQLNEHEFEQSLGVGEGQGSLVCCSPLGHKELDTVIATHSGKETHSEGQCRQWSAVSYTGGPKAELLLGKDPNQHL